jgi:hypothetical protein
MADKALSYDTRKDTVITSNNSNSHLAGYPPTCQPARWANWVCCEIINIGLFVTFMQVLVKYYGRLHTRISLEKLCNWRCSKKIDIQYILYSECPRVEFRRGKTFLGVWAPINQLSDPQFESALILFSSLLYLATLTQTKSWLAVFLLNSRMGHSRIHAYGTVPLKYCNNQNANNN